MNSLSHNFRIDASINLTRKSRAFSAVRACVVGTGPSGFYTAKYLLKKKPEIKIDMIERLPTPFGLVRAGVAPDHPEVKSVQNDFEKVMEDPRIEYFGGIHVGEDVSVEDLKKCYHFLVFANGAEGDCKMGIPGEEELHGIHAARDFVHWYNGHPDFQGLTDQLEMKSVKHVAIIGQGNVALDCARILCKGKLGLLGETDITSVSETMLAESSLQSVLVAGRRGHIQAKWTIKELRELSKIDGVDFGVRLSELALGTTPATLTELADARPKKRINNLLQSITWQSPPPSKLTCEARFLLQPVKAVPHSEDPTRIGSLVLERTHLEGNPGHLKATGTGVFEEIPCDMVLRSIGYKPTPIKGIPFNHRKSVINNLAGRILALESNKQIPGMYCVGWAKRGPTGIIGSNIIDAKETVACIVSDFEHHVSERQTEVVNEGILDLLQHRNKDFISWDEYKFLDAAEQNEGSLKPRDKITSVQLMKEIINKNRLL